MMKAACMNAVRATAEGKVLDSWYRCAWLGEVQSLYDECPRCLNKGRLAPVVNMLPKEPVGAD